MQLREGQELQRKTAPHIRVLICSIRGDTVYAMCNDGYSRGFHRRTLERHYEIRIKEEHDVSETNEETVEE